MPTQLAIAEDVLNSLMSESIGLTDIADDSLIDKNNGVFSAPTICYAGCTKICLR